jgi:hypothetical protein
MQANRNELSRRYISSMRATEEKDQELDKDELDSLLYLLRTETSSKLKALCLGQLANMPNRLCIGMRQLDV